ncbi:CLUMA_CG006883, isoform A [Clunio marinus]|uniref:Exosome complex component RRP40 n=1 Tax=Clunio marinus TaxID=568069 RepID=A0A1J1I3A7_9DIPT|nr:CLUMA_CG006883, isoform A [Clunio marinus]
MAACVGNSCIPGETLQEERQESSDIRKVVLGDGLRCNIVASSEEHSLPVITKNGILRRRKPNIYYVDSYQKRYIPSKNDSVIGIVTTKTLDFFWVDINASEPAALSYLAFEGATKKNRPEINVGDLVFCKVVLAHPDLEPELVCVDSTGKKGNLGQLNDGIMFSCSINLVRKVLNEKCRLLHLLSKETPFELVAGINGRIWVNSNSLRKTILLRDTILKAEHTPYEEMSNIVNDFATELTGIP